MAESAVSFLVEKLVNYLEKEAKLLSGVEEEVAFIKDELEGMTALIRNVDAAEETDEELQVWVRKVREVAHDTEDVIDVFMLSPHGNRFPGAVICCAKKLCVRHRIASEIQSIKLRVVHIAEVHLRYKNPQEGARPVLANNDNASWRDPRGDAHLVEEEELVGIERHKKQLITMLQLEREERLKVVSVVGMGGLGKSTLVKQVFDAAGSKGFNHRAWVTVTNSFKIQDVLKDMVDQLFDEKGKPTPQAAETVNMGVLKTRIKEFLRPKKFFVVFDDVWRTDTWEALKLALPNNKFGSRVMLTTRSESVASGCRIETGDVYTLQPLSQEESKTLFCKKAFQGQPWPEHLEEACKSILQRCDGLPLAIVTIGGVLATKAKNRVDEWDGLRRNLVAELEDDQKVSKMHQIFSLSYKYLPYCLKICFLYLSIFPGSHQIECMRLIRLWTAEGFVQERSGKTKEEVAEEFLAKLIDRSLIQPVEKTADGRVKTCRVHDLLRECITSKPLVEDIVGAAIATEQSTKWPKNFRRLSVHDSLKNVQQGRFFSKLRSLLMFGVADPLSLLSELFNGGLRLLKVLDLRDASLETIPDEVFNLSHLRYLSLRGTKVKTIPSSIGNLEYLETLDLKETHVAELPDELLKLKRLRHLLVYRYSNNTGDNFQSFHFVHGCKTPVTIGGFPSLQKLCHIDASYGSTGSITGELGKLTQLRRLGIVKLRSVDGIALCSSVEKLTSLRSLSLNSIKEDDVLNIQSLSPPPRFIRGLYLRGRLEKTPAWISSLQNLAKVFLGWSKLEDDPLPSLRCLPNLVDIELHRAYQGEELCFKAGSFRMLKTLRLSELRGLKNVVVEKDAMPQLENLYVVDCDAVDKVPSGIEHLKHIKLLDWAGVGLALYKSLDRDKGEDYHKIAHIPQINIGIPKTRVL